MFSFPCLVCSQKIEVPDPYEATTCGVCGQDYDYDECYSIVLTDGQKALLWAGMMLLGEKAQATRELAESYARSVDRDLPVLKQQVKILEIEIESQKRMVENWERAHALRTKERDELRIEVAAMKAKENNANG